MAGKAYHVIAKSNGKWTVIRTGAARASGIYPTKMEAEREAKNMLIKSGGGELIVHATDGKVSRRDSYGNDPDSPKDNKRNGVGNKSSSVKR